MEELTVPLEVDMVEETINLVNQVVLVVVDLMVAGEVLETLEDTHHQKEMVVLELLEMIMVVPVEVDMVVVDLEKLEVLDPRIVFLDHPYHTRVVEEVLEEGSVVLDVDQDKVAAVMVLSMAVIPVEHHNMVSMVEVEVPAAEMVLVEDLVDLVL